MAVLRVKDINGDWVSIPVIATGDADTLQGHDASYFATNASLAEFYNDTRDWIVNRAEAKFTGYDNTLGTIATTLDEINGTEV